MAQLRLAKKSIRGAMATVPPTAQVAKISPMDGSKVEAEAMRTTLSEVIF